MSNRRRERAEAEFFIYEPGVDVPQDVTHLFVLPGVEVLPEEVFRGLMHLKEVVLSEGLREIDWMAFYECRSLERIRFPSTLVRIGDSAFYGCISLVTVHVPEGLAEISEYVFHRCSALKRISLPRTVTKIGDGAFSGCSSLEVMIMVDGIRTIGDSAFQGCALGVIILPATLTEIGPNAFQDCRSLRMVTLSGGIQRISRCAFEECHLLEHINVTSKCLVATHSGEGHDFSFVFDGSIPLANLDRVVITSDCFHFMQSSEMSVLKVAVTEILETNLRHEWDVKCEQLWALLAPHQRRHKKEVAVLLELSLWKVDMLRSAETGPGIPERLRRRWDDKCNFLRPLLAARGGEVAGLLKILVQEAEMHRPRELSSQIEEESPLTARASVIIENVVAFL